MPRDSPEVVAQEVFSRVSELDRKKQVDLLAQGLLREYMHRRGFTETLKTFDTECPRTAETIASRMAMRRLLNVPVADRESRLKPTMVPPAPTASGEKPKKSSKPTAVPPTLMEEMCSYRLTKRDYHLAAAASSSSAANNGETVQDPSDVELDALNESVSEREALISQALAKIEEAKQRLMKKLSAKIAVDGEDQALDGKKKKKSQIGLKKELAKARKETKKKKTETPFSSQLSSLDSDAVVGSTWKPPAVSRNRLPETVFENITHSPQKLAPAFPPTRGMPAIANASDEVSSNSSSGSFSMPAPVIDRELRESVLDGDDSIPISRSSLAKFGLSMDASTPPPTVNPSSLKPPLRDANRLGMNTSNVSRLKARGAGFSSTGVKEEDYSEEDYDPPTPDGRAVHQYDPKAQPSQGVLNKSGEKAAVWKTAKKNNPVVFVVGPEEGQDPSTEKKALPPSPFSSLLIPLSGDGKLSKFYNANNSPLQDSPVSLENSSSFTNSNLGNCSSILSERRQKGRKVTILAD